MRQEPKTRRRIGLLTITAALAAVMWLVGGAVLVIMLNQQSRIEEDAQHIHDVSSVKIHEATRIIRGLERLAREGDTIHWIDDPAQRAARRLRLQTLLEDAALQGNPEIRALLMRSFAVMDNNLAELATEGAAARGRVTERWVPVMQDIINRSEAEGADVATLATNEADTILQSTGQARDMLKVVAGVTAMMSLVFFLVLYLTLTRPVVRLAKSMLRARQGHPIHANEEMIREMQMLHDAAEALGSAHMALESARNQLEQLAHTDALTGLANRRLFRLHGEQAVAQAQRHGNPLSLVLVDIDHFKHINDRHGHEGGDIVLKSLGAYFLEAVRGAEQSVARMGGEEFALLLVQAPLHAAVHVAERLRSAIEMLEPVLPSGERVHVTASLGVAEFRSSDADLDGLVRRADSALYQAKANGRNRVEVAA